MLTKTGYCALCRLSCRCWGADLCRMSTRSLAGEWAPGPRFLRTAAQQRASSSGLRRLVGTPQPGPGVHFPAPLAPLAQHMPAPVPCSAGALQMEERRSGAPQAHPYPPGGPSVWSSPGWPPLRRRWERAASRHPGALCGTGSACLPPAGHGRGAGQGRPGGGTGLRAEGLLFQHARWLWGFEVCPALLM